MASRRCSSCLERWLLVRQGGGAMMQKRKQTLPRALGEGGLLSCWVNGNRIGGRVIKQMMMMMPTHF